MPDPALKWGIASAGLISHDFVVALANKPDKHKVVAVAARSVDRAKEFADKHGIPNHYGSYEAMGSDPAVQVRFRFFFAWSCSQFLMVLKGGLRGCGEPSP